jgi:heme-degrading monooxygenase HmoA
MQVCTFHEYEFLKAKDAYYAFAQMGKGPSFLKGVDGLVAVKMMGTGSGNGFSIVPNLKRYAFFMVWDSEQKADQFLKDRQYLEFYNSQASSKLIVKLRPTKTHGNWSGENPLLPSNAEKANALIAVLTRATIRPAKLLDFWWNVPTVSKFMSDADGVLYRIGVGEYPLFMQATFSIWASKEVLMKAAYANTAHAEAVRKTRERNWYAEEMFTRFEVLAIQRKGPRYEHLPLI